MATKKQESLLGYVEPYQASKDEEYMGEAMRAHFRQDPRAVEAESDGRSGSHGIAYEGRSGEFR